MIKVNLIGDYEGRYRISGIEWVLAVVNMVLLLGLVLLQCGGDSNLYWVKSVRCF